ncbi:MAG TPA: GntR family transcriptional regulator, partial [Clostridiaceae bacterium]|nr:GntR family transcriptional regulator [Clostridiaceae bacterium]
MDINFSNQMPIYVQIMNLIKLDIVTKKLRGGDKLLSVREMSENLKVNPNTIQRAYQELEREGITYTQRGMGTFVNDDNDMIRRLKNEMA